MEEKLYSAILSDTYTARKLQKRLRVLKNYFLSQFFNSSAPTGDEDEIVEEREWLESIDKENLAQITKDNVYQVFANLEARIKQIKLLTIYIAFDLPKEEITRLGKKLRVDYGGDFIFDVKFDPNIIGGSALVWGGVYKDYSVRSLIEHNKQDILGAFRSYVVRKQ